jgi:hypothetical protein
MNRLKEQALSAPPEHGAIEQSPALQSTNWQWHAMRLGALVLLTALAMLVQGYHPGLEDDAFYLAAIKKNLHPALFPHDSDFFQVQFQATIFDKLIAFFIRLTHLPVGWAVLLWQFASIFLILWGCWAISQRCFREAHTQWTSVALVAFLLNLPVTGIGLTLVDQYLHPRALATAAILGAIVATLEKRRGLAALLLGLALMVHALMASFGVSLCLFLGWEPRQRSTRALALALPLGWVFEPASEAWRQAAATRPFYHLREWHWYEWLGVFGPLLLLWIFRLIARRDRSPMMARLCGRLLAFGIFQLAVGLVIMLTPGLERLRPFEPMRFLHLIYLLFFLLAGGLIEQYLLRAHVYRALLLFIPLAFGMFYAQRQMFPSTEHFEWPGATSRNAWVKAFYWIRQNTLTDSQFAIDPYYMALPGEDYHGFRALAERSVLADYVKDAGMVARVPHLAKRWRTEVDAQRGWRNFQPADFQRLKTQFGVNWVVLARRPSLQPDAAEMPCPYQNDQVLVCRVD